MRAIRFLIFLIIGFYLCGLLTIVPIPKDYEWYRPLWMLLFVIFCQLQFPRSFNPIYAWFIGLLLDCLSGGRLGEYAIIFSIICYLTAALRQRFSVRPLWQQIGKIFLLACGGQIMVLWFHVFAGQNPHTLMYWLGSLSSCLVWPFFYLFMQSISPLLSVAPYPSRIA